MQAIESMRAALHAFAAPGLPRLLFITHAWGGGVEEHVALLATLVAKRARVMVMRPAGLHEVELELPGRERFRVASVPWHALTAALRALQFSRVHIHHVHALPLAVLDIDLALALPLDFTLHDYVSICPQHHLVDEDGTYCGEPEATACNRCIAKRPHAWQQSIGPWRAGFEQLLTRADRVFAPSNSVAERIRRYFPNVAIATHAPPEALQPPPRVVKVALLGGLTRAKGLRVAINVAAFAKATDSPLLLRLIGHASEPLAVALPLQATGSYDAAELPVLIASERPDVIWFPSQVPETFSFTLSAAIDSGAPIVASNMGAVAERLRGNARAVLLPPTATPSEWHEALLAAAGPIPPWSDSGVAAEVEVEKIRAKRADHAAHYVERYLDVAHDASTHQSMASAEPMLHCQANSTEASEAANAPGAPAILDAFRIGVYGGHRASIQLVERALAALPSGELHVAGRTQYAALTDRYDRAALALQTLRDDVAAASRANLRAQTAVETAERQALAARTHIDHLEGTLRQQQAQHAALQTECDMLHASWSLRVTKPLRTIARVVWRGRQIGNAALRLIPRIPALSGRAMERYRRGGWRSLVDRMLLEFQPVAADAAVVLPDTTPAPMSAFSLGTTVHDPAVSILIPVFGQHETTFACLRSIRAHPTRRSFEVIVMDDCSPEPAADALSMVSGIRVIRNPQNLGFIGNINAAAAQSRGQWLIILNNDTVLRQGALDALLDTFDAHPNVGLVGAKLLNADGTVQDAGGIVWRDGSAWNYGRGQDREDPRYNYVRDADYCSGAALAINRNRFTELGGFDPYYAPAYYEDTDLAFRIRAKGLRVIYQPAAEIFHIEGVTHGRDESAGIKAYQATNRKKFFARWQQTIMSHREPALQPDLEAHRASRSNILIVEACMVTPDQDSGSVRMFNLMRILIDDGHHVSFVAHNLDGDATYAARLTAMGVEVLHGRFAGSVRQVLRERGPNLDTIVFCRYYIASQYVSTVRTVAPRARIVFDTVDLHFLREEREAALTGDAMMLRSAAATRRKEIAVMEKCDTTLVVSAVEKKLLADTVPHIRVAVVSNIHPSVDDSTGALPPRSANDFNERTGALFIGGFRHPPNVDAIKWYVEQVLPILRQMLPDVTTTVVGSHMPADVVALQREGLVIRGFVPDINPLLRAARVAIAPLRYGSGVKGKINEAMNYGIPVVATECAVEGMQLVDGRDVLVADDPGQFAQAIVRLHTDAELWNALSAAGRANVKAHFSPDAARPAIRALLVR